MLICFFNVIICMLLDYSFIYLFGYSFKYSSNNCKVEDSLLNFLYRFIYKYRSTVEIGNLAFEKCLVFAKSKVILIIIIPRFPLFSR